ncbi:MAG: transporter [Bacteroidetes bacterium]|nr:transporter [Bacteroidota bacterium]
MLKAQEDVYETSLEDMLNQSMNKAFILGLPHPHSKGEFMVQYQFMGMGATQIHDGTNELSPSDVLANYQQTPTKMKTLEHMFMGMYAPSDRLTLMLSGKFINSTMDMETYAGTMSTSSFTEKASGFGDMNLLASYLFLNRESHNLLLSAGLSLPAGSVGLNGSMGTLPYSMQTGTGTFDPGISLTYMGSTMKWSWGTDLGSTFRLYDNKRDYKTGNLYQVSVGGAYQWLRWFSTSAKVQGFILKEISGNDASMDASLSPVYDSRYTGGKTMNATIGAYFRVPDGFFKNNTFSIDYKQNVYENMNGIQLAPDKQIVLTWQWIFGIKTIK